MIKRATILILALIYLGSCTYSGERVSWTEGKFYYVDLLELNERFYFEGPVDASFTIYDREGMIVYDDCNVDFGSVSTAEFRNSDEFLFGKTLKDVNEDGRRYEAWFDGELLIFYLAFVESYDFGFWIKNTEIGVKSCTKLVDDMLESLRDDRDYQNVPYGFGFSVPEDYTVNYFGGNNGVMMRKGDVSIAVYALNNIENYKSVYLFLESKYPGFQPKFVKLDELIGILNSFEIGGDRIQMFTTIGESGRYIYQAFLKVTDLNFEENKNIFEEMLRSLDLY